MVISGRSVNLITLFLGRRRPPKWLTSTKCTYFLATALLESTDGEKKVCGRTGYQTGTSDSCARRAIDCFIRSEFH